jgi:hypothetical protein
MRYVALVRRTLKDTDCRGEVVDAPGSTDSCGDDRGRGDEIVSEAVVQVTLQIVSWAVPQAITTHPTRYGVMSVRFKSGVTKRTWSSKTSLTLSNSFSYLFRTQKMLALQLLESLTWSNGCRSSSGSSFPCFHQDPSTDASYLAVNSSKVSSACWSLFLAADCEKARWAVQAMGVARDAGALAPTRLTCDAERTKDMLRVN